MAIGNPISLTNNVASKDITVSAVAGQTSFTVEGGYRINQLSVFRNGIKLNGSDDFTALDGLTVTLVTECNDGDRVQFQVFDDFRVADAIVSAASSQSLNGDLAINGTLHAASFGKVTSTGTVTANRFVGDGSQLTNIVASGSGIEVQDSGSVVGTAGTINFANNLNVSSLSLGIVTVTATGGGSGITTENVVADTLEVTGITTLGVVTSVTSIEATKYYGDTSDAVSGRWTLGNNGTNDYTFTGPGLIGTENDPTIYVQRGMTYQFVNNMGAHPFRIQSTVNGSTGTQYNDGITNNDVSNGTLTWNVQFDAPETLYYQCTVHPNMGGRIIVGEARPPLQSRTVVTGTTGSLTNNSIGNIQITGFKSYSLLRVGLSTAAWFRLYTDSTSRTNDSGRSIGEDPAAGSGVIAEVVTTGVSTTQNISPFVMGGNMDDPATTTMYVAITNTSGTTQTITANLTILQLED